MSLVHAGARRDALATLAVVGACVAFAAGSPLARRLAPRPSPERCTAMLARYAEQAARAHRHAPPPARLSLDVADVARCTRELTDVEVTCALAANSADEIERCLW